MQLRFIFVKIYYYSIQKIIVIKMPKPAEGETEKEFIARCIPEVMNDGTAETVEQAYAICISKYNEKSINYESLINYFNDSNSNR